MLWVHPLRGDSHSRPSPCSPEPCALRAASVAFFCLEKKTPKNVKLRLCLGSSNTRADCASKKWQSFKILYSVKKRQGK